MHRFLSRLIRMHRLPTNTNRSAVAASGRITSALLCLGFIILPQYARAQAVCTPDAGYTVCRAYTYTGADQAFTVPAGVASIKAKAWAAGGGGSIASSINIGAPGGSGGYVEGVLSVTPGSQYVVVTGEGGGADGTAGTSNRCLAAYGFGGACPPARNGSHVDGGGGGGLSGLFTGNLSVTATSNGRAVLVAGGGGAGEGSNGCGNVSAAGGAGGNGFAGTMATMQGANGAYSNGSAPTGGGGGYLGGAGTTRLRNGTCIQSANGGSNFIAGGIASAVNLAGSEAPSVPNYTVKNPPRTTEPQYLSGVGVGQLALAQPGGNGLVVLQWVDPLEVDLAISKDDGSATYTPGLNNTYTIVVSNSGPDAVTGARIQDPLPAGISSASWSCGNATGGGVCGATNGSDGIDSTANLPAGGSVTYTFSLAVPSSYTGNLTNTATVTAPTGVTDTNLANNDDSDTDTQELPPVSGACAPRTVAAGDTFTLSPFPGTGSVTKVGPFGTGAAQWASAGGNYTITWTFSDPVPAQWLRIGLTHVDSPSPSFTVSLTGTATRSDFAVLPGSGLAYNPSTGVLTRSAAGRQAGSIQAATTNTVTSISIQGTAIEATDSVGHILWVRPPCMTVQKVSEGGTGSFTIDMTNVAAADGTAVPSTTLTTTTPGTAVSSPQYFAPNTASDITLSEVVPAGWNLASAVCTDENAGNTGNPSVIGTFASPTLTIPADNVRPEADIVCSFSNRLQMPTIDLAKTTLQVAGGPFGFTLGNTTVVSPASVSTSAAGSAVAVDGDPGAGTTFTAASLGADVTIDESSLPSGWIVDSATCTNGGGAVVGALSGRVYTIPAASVTAGESFACDFVNAPPVNLRIDKVADSAAVRTGDTVTYTIVVINDGPGTGDGALLTDPLVPGVDCSAGTLTCENAIGGAVCPSAPTVAALQGAGVILPTFPADGSLQFVLTCTVTATGQ